MIRLFKKSSSKASKSNADPDWIMIVGAAKTGTTGLYHSIREALPEGSISWFEPKLEEFKYPDDRSKVFLIKTFAHLAENFEGFNKKILITRDPRDQFLSALMYHPFGIIFNNKFDSEEKTKDYLETLQKLMRKKEEDPRSVTVKEIHDLYSTWNRKSYGKPILEYYKNNTDVFLLRYEDFVDGNLDELNKYLGLNIKVAQDVPEKRVIRTKAYNNWKNWFTPSDVEYYKDVFKKYMEIFDYKEDWELNENPSIDPKEGTIYIEKIISDAREMRTKRELS